MNRVIEVDFLPRETDVASSYPDSINDSARRILIIDNDKNTTHSVKVLLEKTGSYLVFEENDSTKAYHTARNFRPHLIFLDVAMPDLDKGQIAAQIQTDSDLQNTPIIFFSAEAKSVLQIEGYRVLAKPVNISEVINIIEGHLLALAKDVD
ncbi:MAG: response regulator [Verrucomicrobia bacterium]|nr:response regulator [Verrucomicrobiota bacterium]